MEHTYLRLIQEILTEGYDCDDRTGTGTKSIFGTQMKFDLSSFPLLTTKKMSLRIITEELLWFLRGETDNKTLQEKKVRIWNGNSSREFLDKVNLHHLREGDIGAAYGFQFRHFGAKYIDCDTDYSGQGFDQVQYVLNLIKNEPNSRRMIINLWNPPDLKKAVLPPCHMVYQFRVYGDSLHCSMYQRSGDVGLGVPFNIASASLMTYLFSHLTGLKPGKLTHTIGDAHIYNDHIDSLKEQITRVPFPFPKLKIENRNQKCIEDYVSSDFKLFKYNSHSKINMKMAV
jgi:thymidylate synthase